MGRGYKHGLCDTRLYRIWTNMKSRCSNPNTPNYERYGGRGIYYCNEWENFKPFYDWATTNGYKEDLTLDRIDNSKGYSPENCKWSDYVQQARNTRRNHYITFRGVTKCLVEWAKELNIPSEALSYKLKKQEIKEIFEEIKNGGYRAKKGLKLCKQ